MSIDQVPQSETRNLIHDFTLSRVSAALTSFKISSQLSHSGFKGEVREIFVRDIINPLLSPDMGCGSGIIIDRFGAQSAQTDVAIYAKDVIPSINFVESAGIYPIESCFYAIEVKSCITTKQIKQAVDNAVKLTRLNNLFHPLQNGRFGPASTIPRSVLFGFSSDLKPDADAEFKRFQSIIDGAPRHLYINPPIRAFCVANCAYWYYSTHNVNGKEREGWYKIDSDGKYSEVVSLVGGIFNTIIRNKFERYGLPFGNYLIKDLPLQPQD